MRTTLKTSPVDVLVADASSLILFTPVTPAGKEWIENHLPEDARWLGNAVVVEHRYAPDIATGMIADGLNLQPNR